MKTRSSTLEKIIAAVVCLGLGISVALTLFQLQATKQRATTAELRIKSFCSLVKATLTTDVREIRKKGALRSEVIARVYGYDVGDGNVSLAFCMPKPFDIDAWIECRDNGNDACMIKMLETASASIP